MIRVGDAAWFRTGDTMVSLKVTEIDGDRVRADLWYPAADVYEGRDEAIAACREWARVRK